MCTKCCAYEEASPFVRKCGSAAGARRGGGKPCEEKVWARGELKCIMSGGAKRRRKKGKSPGERRERGEGAGKEGKKPRKRNEMVARRKTWKDLYPFKGIDLCREVYPRGN